jgi:hypothetical protein
MANTKLTKKDILTVVKYIGESAQETGWQVEKDGVEIEVTGYDLVEFAETAIDQLDRKAAAAKAKAEKVKAEGDELRDKIAEVLTDDYQTIPQIVAAVGIEDLTPAKVTARLTQLIKAGKAHKDKVKTSDNRKINGYAAGPAPEVEGPDSSVEE